MLIGEGVSQLDELLDVEEVQGVVAQRGEVADDRQPGGLGPARDLGSDLVDHRRVGGVVGALDRDDQLLGAALAGLDGVERMDTRRALGQQCAQIGVDLDAPAVEDRGDGQQDRDEEHERAASPSLDDPCDRVRRRSCDCAGASVGRVGHAGAG